MLSPCLFVVLLAIGYFFIDKKTQTELISKCKKNKFIILGGIVFIYYFFLRNSVEGLTPDQYHPLLYQVFIKNLCYEQDGMTKTSLEHLNKLLEEDYNSLPEYEKRNTLLDRDYKLSETNQTQCLLDGMGKKAKVEVHLSQNRNTPGGSLYITEGGPSSATQQGPVIDLAGSIQVAGNP